MPITSPLAATTAAALHEQLQHLERERATAALAGLTTNELYLTDLHAEIEATRNAYVGAAVTEIASLRAELDGPLRG